MDVAPHQWFGYESRNRLNRSAAAANAVSLRTKDRRRPRLDGVDGMDALLRRGFFPRVATLKVQEAAQQRGQEQEVHRQRIVDGTGKGS